MKQCLFILGMLALCAAMVAGQLSAAERDAKEKEGYPGCYPYFYPRPDCLKDNVEGWYTWKSMQYRYFPNKLSRSDAHNFCDPWDEAVCKGEYPDAFVFRCHIASYAQSGELAAIKQAYDDACIKSGNLFWTGVTGVKYGKLQYTDRTSTTLNSFPGNKIPSDFKGCVALKVNSDGSLTMEKKDCNTKLPFVCKIQIAGH